MPQRALPTMAESPAAHSSCAYACMSGRAVAKHVGINMCIPDHDRSVTQLPCSDGDFIENVDGRPGCMHSLINGQLAKGAHSRGADAARMKNGDLLVL